MEQYIGYAFGTLWAITTIVSLLVYDPNNVDPEIDKLWHDNS
jgi:hypothetical protein